LLNHFYQKLERLLLYGEGKINILHMGGSHVQADVYTNELRQNLGKYCPEQQGARGLVFPFRIAKTNGPPDFTTAYKGEWTNDKIVGRERSTKLGLMGISVTTKDTASSFQIHFNHSKYLPQHFNRIKLFHEIDSLSFQAYWPGNDSIKFTPYPDLGYTLIELPTYCDSISIGFKKTDSLQNRFTLYGMYLESDEPGITYNSVGINGAATWSYLKCELFEQQVKEIHPDLVFFAIGINDAHNTNFTQAGYENNYKKIIEMIRAANPAAMLVFITNNDSYSYSKVNNSNAEAVESAMFNLAKTYNGAVWNMFRVMGGYQTATIWRANHLMKNDRIHFNREGYTLMGDLIFNALMEKYGIYLSQSN
jgi:lysophospholipase L1-like esterase